MNMNNSVFEYIWTVTFDALRVMTRIPASSRHSRPGLANSAFNCKRRASLTRRRRRRRWERRRRRGRGRRGDTWCWLAGSLLLRAGGRAVSPLPCSGHMVPPCIHSCAAPKLALKTYFSSKVWIWQTSGFTNLWIKICYATGSEAATKSKREDARLALSRTTLRDEFRIDLCLCGTKWWYNSRFPI